MGEMSSIMGKLPQLVPVSVVLNNYASGDRSSETLFDLASIHSNYALAHPNKPEGNPVSFDVAVEVNLELYNRGNSSMSVLSSLKNLHDTYAMQHPQGTNPVPEDAYNVANLALASYEERIESLIRIGQLRDYHDELGIVPSELEDKVTQARQA